MTAVAVCDDHLLFVEALSVVLEARGYSVAAQAAHPSQALEAVRAHAVDVFLVDLHFPDGNAVSHLAELLATSPSTKVLVLSGSTDDRLLAQALVAGARGVVDKRESIDRIVNVVERVLAGEVVVPARVLSGLTRLAADGVADDGQPGRFLSGRERQVLEGLVRGESTARLAADLGIRYSTVRTHIQNVLTKLGVHSKLEAVALAVEHGMVPPGRTAGSDAGGAALGR